MLLWMDCGWVDFRLDNISTALDEVFCFILLTRLFPMHPFSTPLKH